MKEENEVLKEVKEFICYIGKGYRVGVLWQEDKF